MFGTLALIKFARDGAIITWVIHIQDRLNYQCFDLVYYIMLLLDSKLKILFFKACSVSKLEGLQRPKLRIQQMTVLYLFS